MGSIFVDNIFIGERRGRGGLPKGTTSQTKCSHNGGIPLNAVIGKRKGIHELLTLVYQSEVIGGDS